MSTFLLIGRYFWTRARGLATDVLGALRALTPSMARIRRRDGRDVEVPLAAVAIGDVMVIRPGETAPADGIITEGASSFDTSSMTGEPTPVDVGVGDRVLAGTGNIDGLILARVEQVGARTQLEQMAILAEQAQARKARVQRLVDRVVAVFVPAVLIIAGLTLAGWMISGAPIRSAFSAALSVLIIACPCALGLATPTALMVGSGRAGQLGIVVKGPDAFEMSGEIDTVVLDKTGTLTTGELQVERVEHLDQDGSESPALVGPASGADDVQRLGAFLEHHSEHPIGRAITRLHQMSDARAVRNVRADVGAGISGEIDGVDYRLGQLRWLRDGGAAVPSRAEDVEQEAERQGRAVVFLADEHRIMGAFVLADTLKASAATAIAQLKSMGLRIVLLTGDASVAGTEVGQELGVDTVISGVLPAAKAAAIESLQAGGSRVVMVGDGINDAAALATADLGMAVLNGTSLAMRSADVILVRPHLGVIADAVALSRRTLRTIRGNLIWAFGYNVAAIPLAAAGWLNPLIAGFAMSFSSLFVVGNSLRLRRFESLGRDETTSTPSSN